MTLLRHILVTTMMAVAMAADLNATVVANSANFASLIALRKVVMVYFTAPWCEKCQAFLPAYEAAAATLRDEGANALLAVLDCVENDDIYRSQEIKDFPTMKVYIDGEVLQYKELMTSLNIVSFMERMSENSISSLSTQGGLGAFVDSYLTHREPVAIGFFSSLSVEETFVFDFACKKFFTIPCAVSDNVTEADMLHVAIPSIVILRLFADEEFHMVAPPKALGNVRELVKWMQMAGFPALTEYSEDNEELIYSLKRLGFNTHVVTVVDSRAESGTSVIDSARQMARAHGGRAVFSYADAASSSPFVQSFIDGLGITGGDIPTVLIAQSTPSDILFFQYDNDRGQLDSENMMQFFSDFLDGTIPLLDKRSQTEHDIHNFNATADEYDSDLPSLRRRFTPPVNDSVYMAVVNAGFTGGRDAGQLTEEDMDSNEDIFEALNDI